MVPGTMDLPGEAGMAVIRTPLISRVLKREYCKDVYSLNVQKVYCVSLAYTSSDQLVRAKSANSH